MQHFQPNDAVAHEKYGIGLVNAIEGRKICVDFGKAGLKQILDTFLRKPTPGILPFNPPQDNERQSLSRIVGSGNVPFVVTHGAIDQFVGVTVARFEVAIDVLDVTFSANLHFHLEDEAPLRRAEHLARFHSFCAAVGIVAPQDIDEFTGLTACLRVSAIGDLPEFTALAA